MFGTQFSRFRSLDPRYTYLIFAVALGIRVGVSYRPARDDWNNWANLRDIPLRMSSIPTIVTNSWCCTHEKRTFFISWMIQWPITHLGRFAVPLMTVLLVSVLILNGLLAVLLLSRYVGHTSPVLLGLFIALGPGAIVVGGWANNLFFVFPVMFGLLFVLTSLSQLKLVRSLMIPNALLTVFSGETGIPILCAAVLLICIFCRSRKLRSNSIMTLCIVGLVVVFHREIAAGPPTSVKPSIELLKNYLFNYVWQEFLIWNPTSWIYRPHLSGLDYGIVAVIAGCLGFALLSYSERRQVSVLVGCRARVIVSVILLTFASILGPVMGALTGVRPGPDLRYHYLSYVVASALLLFVATQLAKRFSRVLTIALILLFSVGHVQAIGSRSNQSSVDQQVWREIEDLLKDDTRFIITLAYDRNYPMPPYYSFAESDFQADWGISGYLRWTHQREVKVFSRLDCDEVTCVGHGYYGEKIILGYQARDESVFIATTTPISPEGLSLRDFRIVSTYPEYLQLIDEYHL